MKTALRNWLNRWQGQGERRQPDQASILANCDEQSSQPSAAPQPAPQQPRQEQKQEPPQQAEPKQQQAQEPAAQQPAPKPSRPPVMDLRDFFAECGEANRYSIREVIGKGSYGIVCSAVDNYTGERVAIKKITNVFEHVSDATRILREIKLLRLLKHPDIVEIKHIMLPPSPRDYKDIYVVFELLETDLHQVIKANDDLTPEHHQFFLYQMLRGLKYIHSAKVFHRDLKPKNILANSDCKLKICDFGLARPAFNDMPTTIFWTDYVATRWYRAPELCGSFFAKYSPAIDLWSVGCIFAEVLLGKPLFPGRNVVHQLEIITDLLGTPSEAVINKVRNEKARRFLAAMKKKPPMPFEQVFPNADPGALRLLKRLLAFDPAERPSAEEALADPYFEGLHCDFREPVAQPISKLAFEFDRRKLTMEDVRELIYKEILEYHPNALRAYHLRQEGVLTSGFQNPSALENFKRQFAHLEQNPGAVLQRGGVAGNQRLQPSPTLPRELVHGLQGGVLNARSASGGIAPAAAYGITSTSGGGAPPTEYAPSGADAMAPTSSYTHHQSGNDRSRTAQASRPAHQQATVAGGGGSHRVEPGYYDSASAAVQRRDATSSSSSSAYRSHAAPAPAGPPAGAHPASEAPSTRYLLAQTSMPMPQTRNDLGGHFPAVSGKEANGGWGGVAGVGQHHSQSTSGIPPVQAGTQLSALSAGSTERPISADGSTAPSSAMAVEGRAGSSSTASTLTDPGSSLLSAGYGQGARSTRHDTEPSLITIIDVPMEGLALQQEQQVPIKHHSVPPAAYQTPMPVQQYDPQQQQHVRGGSTAHAALAAIAAIEAEVLASSTAMHAGGYGPSRHGVSGDSKWCVPATRQMMKSESHHA